MHAFNKLQCQQEKCRFCQVRVIKNKAFWSWSVIGNQFLSMGDLNNFTFMKIFKSLGHCISWGKGLQANRDSFHITGLKSWCMNLFLIFSLHLNVYGLGCLYPFTPPPPKKKQKNKKTKTKQKNNQTKLS